MNADDKRNLAKKMYSTYLNDFETGVDLFGDAARRTELIRNRLPIIAGCFFDFYDVLKPSSQDELERVFAKCITEHEKDGHEFAFGICIGANGDMTIMKDGAGNYLVEGKKKNVDPAWIVASPCIGKKIIFHIHPSWIIFTDKGTFELNTNFSYPDIRYFEQKDIHGLGVFVKGNPKLLINKKCHSLIRSYLDDSSDKKSLKFR